MTCITFKDCSKTKCSFPREELQLSVQCTGSAASEGGGGKSCNEDYLSVHITSSAKKMSTDFDV